MAVKTFTSERLTSSDVNTYLTNSGLVYIKQQTVGSNVGAVTVTDAFSASFDNYYITYTGGTLNGLNLVEIYMGNAAGTAYYGSRNAINTSAAAALALFMRIRLGFPISASG